MHATPYILQLHIQKTGTKEIEDQAGILQGCLGTAMLSNPPRCRDRTGIDLQRG